MKLFLTVAILFTAYLISGCARMGTRQIDENTTIRYELDKKGQTNAVTHETRKTSTKAAGTAVGAGRAGLKGFEAIQGGETQGLKIKESTQQTDGLMQAVQAFQSLSDIARMMKGFPPSQSVAPQPESPPAGMKWILAPKDTPSQPQPEIE